MALNNIASGSGSWFSGGTNPNKLTEVIPQLLMQSIEVLRNECVMPRLVNNDYSEEAAKRGATIDIPLDTNASSQDVITGPVLTQPPAQERNSAKIDLNRWIKSEFYFTDNDILSVQNGAIPSSANSAVVTLAETVNKDILDMYKRFYGAVGTPGRIPFVKYNTAGVDLESASDINIIAARTKLTTQKCPKRPRTMVLDPTAFGRVMGLQSLQNSSWNPRATVLSTGNFNEIFGFDWAEDQQVPRHVSAAGDQETTTANTHPTVTANVDKGARNALTSTVALTSPTDTTKTAGLVIGDIITFAGHDQQYVVLPDNDTPIKKTGTDTNGNLINRWVDGTQTPLNPRISPALKVALVAATQVTVVKSHTANLAFHRDSIGFASRPLAVSQASGMGVLIDQISDPVSGLTLRLEVSRGNKEMIYCFDILYGLNVIRPELGIRVLGQ